MGYGWFGNYQSWAEALADAKGYDDNEIFEKTKSSIQEVISKQKKYERDTILFDRIELEYHQSVLCGLLKVALSTEKKQLNVLDFGGSLGTLYFAVKEFLNPVQLNWNIIEQSHYVEYGRKNIKDINFYYTFDECIKKDLIDVIIFSSVLQYVEEPYITLEKALSLNVKFIILERTAILPKSDLLTVQKVPPSIYNSSYPAWFLNEQKIISLFQNQNYVLLADFKELWNCNISNSQFKGYIFVKDN